MQVFSESPAHPSWSWLQCLFDCSSPKHTGWGGLTPAIWCSRDTVPPSLPSISNALAAHGGGLHQPPGHQPETPSVGEEPPKKYSRCLPKFLAVTLVDRTESERA